VDVTARTVCGDRDEAYVTVFVPPRCVVRSDAQETGILALKGEGGEGRGREREVRGREREEDNGMGWRVRGMREEKEGEGVHATCAPLFGCADTAANPVISARSLLRLSIISM
jgi:hypothetical protein